MQSYYKNFECKKCGDCCKGYGGTYINDYDAEQIASYIGINIKNFKENYCQVSCGKLIISQGESGYCIFWNKNLCSIHPVKPRMCKEWPFIKSLNIDPDNWNIMAEMCPGMESKK
ncbi:MAG: YkgJ family cysteine cluster protein [Desulfobacterales bacterium]|nr:YkgJ family cysteine cluster protein [Desulfobacterales bacterium]